MRIHRLELSGVGPFRDPQEIDFDTVGAQGLFLIDGPTGAGKTTIIDSIVYALFGRVSGSESDDARMRSDYLAEGAAPSIACEFSVDGRRHRIERTLAHTRPPLRGSGAPVSVPEQRVLTELGADGEPLQSLTREREITDHLQTLVGLDAEQFRKLVVLPQGEFAALLRMPPTDRGKVLEPLLGDRLYRRIQEALEAGGQLARRERAEADAGVLAAAQRLRGALQAFHAEEGFPDDAVLEDPQASDDARLDAATAAVAWLDDQAQTAQQARDEDAVLLAEAQAGADRAEQARDAIEALERAHADVDAARLALPDAADDVDGLRAEVATLERTIGELAQFVRWEDDAAAREERGRSLQGALQAAEHARDELHAEQACLPADLRVAEEQAQAAQVAAGRAPEARLQLQALAQQADVLERKAALRARAVGAEQELERARVDAQRTDAARQTVGDELDKAVERQRRERSAMLAQALEHGEPCPVCGSTEHPAPATAGPDAEVVSDDAVDALRRDVAIADAADQTARIAVERAAAVCEGLHAQEVELAERAAGVDPDRLAQDTADWQEVLREAEAAEGRVPALQKAVADIRARQQQMADLVAEAERAVAGADADRRQFARTEAETRARLVDLVGEHVTAHEVVARAEARIAAVREFERALDALRLAQAAVPAQVRGLDAFAIKAAAVSAADAVRVAQERQRLLADRYARLAGAVQAVRPLHDAVRRAIEKRLQTHEQTTAAVDLGDIASGGRGNTRKLPLRAYALQLRFRSVLEAASRHLERMSDGKYSLELKEDVRQGYAGLGIAVRDAWTGAAREPKTLSGGETFYASLSLALGLAEVVQAEAGGRALETLFVDEGFGSLDADTLDKVIDQLDRLRSGGRVVGVVSHVTEMKEVISDRIEVRVQPDRTSAITMVC